LNVVNEHKQKAIKDFSTSMRGRSLLRNHAALWRTPHICRDLEVLEFPRQHIGPTIDAPAAPRPIIQLAQHVSRELRGSEFELEWFRTGPVLNAIGGGHRACLGIWDGGGIVAIADHDGWVPVVAVSSHPKEAFWRRCFRVPRR
jgi:hypothetical protein